ncbi:MAG TPA: response regulator [Bacilli bacterium]
MRILVVDDEPLTRAFLREQLPKHDAAWQVVGEAMDGQEAADFLMNEEVDLIITDIKMPVMNGLALCRWVIENGKKQKMIILSGYDEFSLAKEAIRYGVKDYLLKPIQSDELYDTVRRIGEEIEQEKDQELAFRAMRNMSEASRRMAVRQLLKAIVTDSHVEVKALYPLLYKFKISLIESLGMIMVLSLDEESILTKPSVPASDIALFQFILNQIAEELADGSGRGRVFLDEEQNTNILLSGDDEAELVAAGRRLYADIASAMAKHTGLTVSGAIGTPKYEVLQLGASGLEARKLLFSRVVHSGGTLYVYLDKPYVDNGIINKWEQTIQALRAELPNAGVAAIAMLVKEYIGLFPDFRPASLRRYGVHLIRRLGLLSPGDAGERKESAMKLLRELPTSDETPLAKEAVVKLFTNIAHIYAPAEPEEKGEHDVVSRAKEYINAHYAEPLSLALIAEKIGVSSGYLSSIFHQETNESYIKFLSRVRMEQAARLFRMKPGIKVYDVSEQVGYVSVKHFSYVFKQHFGIPPGEYQSLHGRSEGSP